MIDLEKYTRTLRVDTAKQDFKLIWKEVHGPEATEHSPENIQLQKFVNELAKKIVEDYAALTQLSLRIRIAEGEMKDEPEYPRELNNHWCCVLESSDFSNQYKFYTQKDGFMGISMECLYPYVARIPKQPRHNYCGAFFILLSIIAPCGTNEQTLTDTLERIICLASMRYQQEIQRHYPTWGTDYLDAPEIVPHPTIIF